MHFRSPDRDLVFAKAAEIAGDIELVYTGEPKHRDVTFEPLGAIHKPAA